MSNDKQQNDGRIGGYSRRDLLRFGAGAMGFASLNVLARRGVGAPMPTPLAIPRLVVVNLKGGNDGLNTVVPGTLTTYFDRRPGLALEEAETLSLDVGPFATTTYRLHSNLGFLQTAYENGDLAVVHKVGYPDANGSHFKSETIYSRCRRDVSAVGGPEASGWIARLTDVMGASPTAAIAVGSGSPEAFKGGSTPLLSIGSNLSSFQFEVDGQYSTTNDPHRKHYAKQILDQYAGTGLNGQIRNAALLGHELEESVSTANEGYLSDVVYPGGNSLASSLQTAAKLIQSGFDTKVYYVARGGYDTHGGQAGSHANLHTLVNGALDAFSQDMQTMGVWDDTVILVISEFGRKNFENGSSGTDHGAASCFLLLGGAVNGGMYGEDLAEADLLPSNLEYRIDFRSIYKEIVQNHFGVGAQGMATVFPEPLEIETGLGIV